MNYLQKRHKDFIKNIFESCKMNSNPYSILPSFIFLLGGFILLFMRINRYSRHVPSWGNVLYKTVAFHWAFFYMTRIWFLLTKFTRFLNLSVEKFNENSESKETDNYRLLFTQTIIFIFVLILSLLPGIIIAIEKYHSRFIPQFIVWARRDPWAGTEIGVAGHYLERPPDIDVDQNNFTKAYRSKKSTSFDNNKSMNTSIDNMRPSKSLSNTTSDKSTGTSTEQLANIT